MRVHVFNPFVGVNTKSECEQELQDVIEGRTLEVMNLYDPSRGRVIERPDRQLPSINEAAVQLLRRIESVTGRSDDRDHEDDVMRDGDGMIPSPSPA